MKQTTLVGVFTVTTWKYIHRDIATQSPLILSNLDPGIGSHSCNEQNVYVGKENAMYTQIPPIIIPNTKIKKNMHIQLFQI